ncbi:MAG: PAS domain S-box protein [Deltaproteobacteria bacterium]|nr:PAS domain S-box protein [Deltaproteobacteria bacterium]
MTWFKFKTTRDDLSGRLQKLMFFRCLFVSLLLGISIIILARETQVYFGHIQTAHYLLIACVYFLTLVYSVIFKYAKNLTWFAYVQILIDALLVTAIIYTTGGVESFFSFLYMLVIINGSIILYRKGGILTATAASIFYGLLLDLHYFQIIHPLGSRSLYGDGFAGFQVFNLFAVHILAFYLVAYLSSYLSEQIRKSRVELEAKQEDIDVLEVLNENIINSISSGLVALDADGKIMLFNPAAENIFGLSAVDVRGRAVEQPLPFLAPHLNGGLKVSDETVENAPAVVNLSYVGKSGEKRHLRLSISPLALNFEDRLGHVLVFQDMTKITKIEAEMKRIEKLALMGELSAAMAHEIRNPMASISGSIQLLKDSAEPNDVNARLMDIVITEIDRLNRLIKDFQLFAKNNKPLAEHVDLNNLILDSLELFKNSAHWSKKIVVSTDFPRSIQLESDPEQLKQVLWNLFLNACEAMPMGGTLSVMTDLGPEGGPSGEKSVKVVVRDTGEGFGERELSRVFTPFFTTKTEGSGLGLAIAKGIIEGFHGEIRGENHPDGGAMITFHLPLNSRTGRSDSA